MKSIAEEAEIDYLNLRISKYLNEDKSEKFGRKNSRRSFSDDALHY